MALFKPNRERSNWEVLQDTPLDRQTKYRNVYEEQQLVRSDQPQKISATSRIAILWVATVAIALVIWVVVAIGEMISYAATYGGFPEGTTPGVFFGIDFTKLLLIALIDIPAHLVIKRLLMLNLRAQNLLADDSDINQHTNDQHIALPEEVMAEYDWFPDVGAHSSVSPSTMVSHVMLENKGIDKVDFVHPSEAEDADPDAEFYARLDGDRDVLDVQKDPLFDHAFGDALFTASGLPKGLRKWFDPRRIPYNPGNANREKLKGYETVADLVNGDWELPLYEVQRPAGAYIVDGAPVNTMVLAITRAGKGQTVIEPTIDMWTREKRANNIVINDPKGELLQKFYVPAVVRGFRPVQFNLINELKTDIYNPLALAAEAAREGNFVDCSTFVENLAEVFFPVDGSGEDPVWPNAANNAFKRAAFGLIDYYLEEERALRNDAERNHMPADILETKVDQLWGHVTLYNCYQLFVQLTARKRKNPAAKMKKYSDLKKQKAAYEQNPQGNQPPQMSAEDEAYLESTQYKEDMDDANFQSEHYFNSDPNAELDELSLYFAATEELPNNGVRTLVTNANNALKSMGAAEKMLASVYGIAVTAMSFFTDPRIRTLTSGTPSQNTDLSGFSFPRRLGVRFHPDFVDRYHLVGLQGIWQAYADKNFTQSLGDKFYHEGLIKRDGWARYAFDGIFENDAAYLKLELHNAKTGMLVKTFWFRFKKSYQRSLDGRYYVKDPVLDTKIVTNGIIEELVPSASDPARFKRGSQTFESTRVMMEHGAPKVEPYQRKAVFATSVHYSEKPRIMFLVTPPHLMKYAKLILILIKQLVDVSFDQSYMTKSSQKPLYKTRYMLDELGNLQSDGHGIGGFQTMLSIGLGQDQQFTLILQTLQQLRDVYGDSVDKIIQGNAQPLSSQLATRNGYIRMGDVAVGDKILAPSGKDVEVNGVYPRGKRRVYRVTRADGSSTIACGEHLWVARVLP